MPVLDSSCSGFSVLAVTLPLIQLPLLKKPPLLHGSDFFSVIKGQDYVFIGIYSGFALLFYTFLC